jgi:hypothetical protein
MKNPLPAAGFFSSSPSMLCFSYSAAGFMASPAAPHGASIRACRRRRFQGRFHSKRPQHRRDLAPPHTAEPLKKPKISRQTTGSGIHRFGSLSQDKKCL